MKRTHGLAVMLALAPLVGCEGADEPTADPAPGADAAAPSMGGAPGAGGQPGVGGQPGAGGQPASAGGELGAGGEPGAGGAPPAPACVPDRAAFEADVKPLIQQWCGLCHGESPRFGAPFSLLDYDRDVLGREGQRRVDRIVARLRAGTMPPPAQPQPDAEARMAILQWATCGENMGTPPDGPNPGGFDVDRPILEDPGQPPADSDFFELRADGFRVSPDTRDRYECFTFEAPVDAPRFIRRVETIVDDDRVLHHTILIPGGEGRSPGEHGRCADDNPLSLIYGWAPGQGALQFDEGGIRIEPGQRLTLQIHYNNEAGHADVADSSGVRIYHGPPDGPEVSILTLGPIGFSVPARSVGQATGWCVVPDDTRIVASFPHMHEKGVAFEQVIERADGAEDSVITLDGWSFDSQYIYATPVDLKAGDVLRTTCTYRNEDDRRLSFGPNTADEMCFNFAYVSPPPSITYCNQNQPPIGDRYTPGACAPPGAEAIDAPAVRSLLSEGAPPALVGGPIPEGLFVLDEAEVFVPSFNLGGQFALDPEASSVTAYGAVALIDGVFYFDGEANVHAVANGLAFDQVQALSFSGEPRLQENAPGAFFVQAACGDLPSDQALYYDYDGDRLRVRLPIRVGPINITLLAGLRPVE
ncbi:MAG: hypothetical protein H6704_20180 [Myxococcales bacterium]|nr:hypothetical protein [Myxococcales bacterium]